MKTSLFNLRRSTRFALLLLLLLLAAQSISMAHAIGDNHELKSDLCATCIVGHGLGTAVSSSHDTVPLQIHQAYAPLRSNFVALSSRTSCHLARAPPPSL